MSIKNREYCCSVSKINRPVVIEGNDAIGTRLMNLIMMEPGDDPLHPDMGVGIKSFRYSLNTLDNLKKRIEEQINTYLPFYQGAVVSIVTTPDKICNIEISIGSTVYVYDSENASKPIVLTDLK